jgi:hypothetical protein
VLAALRQNGRALEYASAELRGDREVVLAAVRQNGRALRFPSEDLRNDPQVVTASLAHFYDARSLMGSQLKLQLERLAQNVEAEQARTFVDTELVLEYSSQWKKTIWEKVWLAGQIVDSGSDSYIRHIVLVFPWNLNLKMNCGIVHPSLVPLGLTGATGLLYILGTTSSYNILLIPSFSYQRLRVVLRLRSVGRIERSVMAVYVIVI